MDFLARRYAGIHWAGLHSAPDTSSIATYRHTIQTDAMSKAVSCSYDGTIKLSGRCRFCSQHFSIAIGPRAQEVVARCACPGCIDKFCDKDGQNLNISRNLFGITRHCANLCCHKAFTAAQIPHDGESRSTQKSERSKTVADADDRRQL